MKEVSEISEIDQKWFFPIYKKFQIWRNKNYPIAICQNQICTDAKKIFEWWTLRNVDDPFKSKYVLIEFWEHEEHSGSFVMYEGDIKTKMEETIKHLLDDKN